MKLRNIILVVAMVALLALTLASCGGVVPPPATNPPAGTTGGGATQPGGDQWSVIFKGVDGVPTQFVANGQTCPQPTPPSKDNYDFKGWYNGETKYNFSSPVTGHLELTAKFEPKTFNITYIYGDVSVDEEALPTEYTFSEDKDLYIPAPVDEDDEMFFLGWSQVCIPAGAAGDVELTANWIAKEKILHAYGFEANSPDGKTYIHYGEMQGEAGEGNEDTWFDAPNGTKQYYVSTAGGGWTGFCIQAEWAPVLNFSSGVTVFDGWKSEKTVPDIEYGYDAEGKIVNAWFSSTYGAVTLPGFETFTKGEDYSVSAFFGLGSAAKDGEVANVVINIDVRLTGTGAFPVNFYLRGTNNYDNGQNRVNAFAIDGNGDIVVGEDTIDAARNVYAGGRKVIGSVADGKWHTISLEMSQASGGYNVVIKMDGNKLGETLFMQSNISFYGENALHQLMVFGGNKNTVAAVDAMIAVDPSYTCTMEFDNFVFYAK